MIQLRENDLLWRCYKRFYKDANPPHPRSVCNLWWKAVAGMFLWVAFDLPFLLIYPIAIAGFIYLCMFASSVDMDKPFPYGMPLTLAIVSTGITLAITLLVRFVSYYQNQRTREAIGTTVVLLVIFSFFTTLISFAWRDMLVTPKGEWQIIFLLYSALSIIGIIVITLAIIILCHVLFSKDTSSGKVVRAYLYSFKTLVCPLIKIPGEEEPKVNWNAAQEVKEHE